MMPREGDASALIAHSDSSLRSQARGDLIFASWLLGLWVRYGADGIHYTDAADRAGRLERQSLLGRKYFAE